MTTLRPATPAMQARFRQSLQQRADAASGAVQELLQARLATLACPPGNSADDTAPLEAPATTRSPPPVRVAPTVSPAALLAGLNAHIRAARPGADGPSGEMTSVRHFRQVWARVSAVDQIEQSIVRGPENAGPLNSHMLVLRSLALMRELSPDYLRRFMSHVDTLLWLDAPPVTAGPATNGKAGKGSKGAKSVKPTKAVKPAARPRAKS